MTESQSKRRYRLGKRAEKQEETRRQIVAALIALHEELGPKNTTVSAVAERAGVQRVTVYRHYPDELSLLQACSSEWIQHNPPPDPATWAHIDDPLRQAGTALTALYAYYRSTARMWSHSYRDAEDMPALRQVMAPFEEYLEGTARQLEALLSDCSGPRLVGALLRHVLHFRFWQSLSDQELEDDEITGLVLRWLAAPPVNA